MAKKKPIQRKESLPPIMCKGCGSPFVPKTHKEHFHSPSCREEYYSRTYYKKSAVSKVCPNCNTLFQTSKPGRQAYCTPECREDARKKRLDGVIASLSAERETYLGDRYSTLESDNFRCVFCGKSPRDGIKLDVVNNNKGGLHTLCNLCMEGRKFNKAQYAVHNAAV